MMLEGRLLNIGAGFFPIDIHVRIQFTHSSSIVSHYSQQPGAIWIKPLEPNDFDQMEDDFVREHIEQYD